MSLTVGQAQAVNVLARHVLDLAPRPSEGEIDGALLLLAAGAHKTLGAGVRPDQLEPVLLSTQTQPVARLDFEGYGATIYRSPNSGDVIVELTAPEDHADTITVTLNDDPLS